MAALNQNCFIGPDAARWFNAARGFSETPDGGSFNGGIVNPAREHLKLGQYYYRFVSHGAPYEAKVGGGWWIDAETLHNIYARFRATGDNPNARRLARTGPAASTFREWLALTYEWNAIQEIAIGLLAAPMDAWSGAARQARGGHVFDSRAFGYAPHLSHMFGVKQYFVPDMRSHYARAMPHRLLAPFSKIEAVVAGDIR